jgi:hypothetical protein
MIADLFAVLVTNKVNSNFCVDIGGLDNSAQWPDKVEPLDSAGFCLSGQRSMLQNICTIAHVMLGDGIFNITARSCRKLQIKYSANKTLITN